jgi:hypothetical protein
MARAEFELELLDDLRCQRALTGNDMAIVVRRNDDRAPVVRDASHHLETIVGRAIKEDYLLSPRPYR